MATCEYARRAPVLAGTETFEDIPQLIVAEASVEQYLDQEIPEGWCIPDPTDECPYYYEVHCD